MFELTSNEVVMVSGAGSELPDSCSVSTLVGAAGSGAIGGAVGGALLSSPTGPGVILGTLGGAFFGAAVGGAGSMITCAMDLRKLQSK